jgi:hypothetical protein
VEIPLTNGKSQKEIPFKFPFEAEISTRSGIPLVPSGNVVFRVVLPFPHLEQPLCDLCMHQESAFCAIDDEND